MNIKLMKLELKNLSLYSNNALEIDFFAEKRVYEHEKDNFVVSDLFNHIHKLNNMALVGINATGKTTTLNIILDILKIYIQNKSLSDSENLSPNFDSTLEVVNTLTDGENIYRIESTIEKDELGFLYFGEEFLYIKKITSSLTKKDALVFSEDDKVHIRSKMDNEFLKDEDSIFSGVLNNFSHQRTHFIMDTMRFTNFNFLGFFSDNIPLSFVNYLDPSIEDFRIIVNEKKKLDPHFGITFANSEEEIKADIMELEKYLSSGTIKGINILFNAMVVLQSGGYLLVDEIENHLNKSIVINLINLFTSKINKNGATLIFTTHYTEVLDSIERSDSIYVLRKEKKIAINKFSDLAKDKDRQDKKKSDLLLSGAINTSPNYFSYMNLKKDLQKQIEKEKENN